MVLCFVHPECFLLRKRFLELITVHFFKVNILHLVQHFLHFSIVFALNCVSLTGPELHAVRGMSVCFHSVICCLYLLKPL